jgi:hypothetical protein
VATGEQNRKGSILLPATADITVDIIVDIIVGTCVILGLRSSV